MVQTSWNSSDGLVQLEFVEDRYTEHVNGTHFSFCMLYSLVFPAASRPSINSLISLFPKIFPVLAYTAHQRSMSLDLVGLRDLVARRRRRMREWTRTQSLREIGTHGWQSSGEGNERREVGGRGRTKRSQPVSRAASNSGRAAKTLPLHATGPRPLPSEQYSTPPPPKLRHPPRIPPVPTYAELR